MRLTRVYHALICIFMRTWCWFELALLLKMSQPIQLDLSANMVCLTHYKRGGMLVLLAITNVLHYRWRCPLKRSWESSEISEGNQKSRLWSSNSYNSCRHEELDNWFFSMHSCFKWMTCFYLLIILSLESRRQSSICQELGDKFTDSPQFWSRGHQCQSWYSCNIANHGKAHPIQIYSWRLSVWHCFLHVFWPHCRFFCWSFNKQYLLEIHA